MIAWRTAKLLQNLVDCHVFRQADQPLIGDVVNGMSSLRKESQECFEKVA